MKKQLLAAALAFTMAVGAHAQLIITGVVDGPRTGGLPKAIELFATEDIADLSIYNVETPNNGAVATGSEFALSGSATAGQFIWIAYDGATTGFLDYFGFSPTFTHGVANNNGDDNVILYKNGLTLDQFGVNGEDGTGKPWEYTDGFAYRNNDTGPDASFAIDSWSFSGIDYLDSQGTTGVNGSGGKTVPFGTYLIPEPSAVALIGLGVAGLVAFRRRNS